MRIVDAHVHVLNHYKPMAPFEDMGRVDRLLSHMDGAGVEKAVMLPVVAAFSPGNNRSAPSGPRTIPTDSRRWRTCR